MNFCQPTEYITHYVKYSNINMYVYKILSLNRTCVFFPSQNVNVFLQVIHM